MAKIMVFLICLYPLGRLLTLALTDHLGANPIEFITRSTGTWTLVGILLTLAITPLRRLTGMSWLLKLRRMLGLFAFFYASLHLTTYLWLDQFFDWSAIVRDIVKRPFITVGIAAWLLLLPLVLTSTNHMMKRLGRRWGQLHQVVYVIAILGVLHYWWLVKRDLTQPMIYAVVLTLLLGIRIWYRFCQKRPG
ncbi:sulfoxide reductase heme-binding subunit YedZ [Chitinivorax tropicus]|uniref:Protein-methionine-sulfoxide reductase heme-binding subunit MsrQ n=1 Tax=Chitinivorax tropicus TaxID=714531 RepID=A0A840MLR9_9PROT|nr:protein-methionine-sulfoxide reductase heme-binding subunit MsrQ [Chitinivorax tropicus]MBB5017143.1 sulfoxide reductase heme-binding subunit YedZ [Chitinivorax tropicus]